MAAKKQKVLFQLFKIFSFSAGWLATQSDK